MTKKTRTTKGAHDTLEFKQEAATSLFAALDVGIGALKPRREIVILVDFDGFIGHFCIYET